MSKVLMKGNEAIAEAAVRAFTSSSSPGISLMSEGISYLAGAQLPVVFVNIMRGGTAYCLVVISNRPIGSPIVKKPLHLVAMNRPSLEKFAPILKPNGTVLINTTLIPVDTGRDDLYQVRVPATTIASALGNNRAANVVALGAFVERPGILSFEAIIDSVTVEFARKEKLVDLNLRALEAWRATAVGKKDSLKKSKMRQVQD